MNFLSMDYFAMVAHERSFTRAAEQLHITQQTLSAHIAALEKELGSQLLLRRTPLELTYPGQVFLEYALDFQRKYRQLGRDFADLAGEEKGCVRIGIGTVRGRSILPPVIQAYQRQRPKVDIRIFEGCGDNFGDELVKGELDLAIGYFPQPLPGVELLDLYQEEVVLLISRQLLEDLYGPERQRVTEEVRSRQSLDPLKDCPFVVNSEERLYWGNDNFGWGAEFQRIADILEEPDMKRGQLLAAPSYLIDSRALLAAGLARMRAEPYYFVTDISRWI